MFELRPKHFQDFQAKLVVHAIETPYEKEQKYIARKLAYKATIHRCGQPKFEKETEQAFFYFNQTERPSNQETEDAENVEEEPKFLHTTYQQRLLSFGIQQARINGFTENLNIEILMSPSVFVTSDFQAWQNKKPNQRNIVIRNRYDQDEDEVRDATLPFCGLVNEGMTCYINSLLQALYSLGTFRSLIYRMSED